MRAVDGLDGETSYVHQKLDIHRLLKQPMRGLVLPANSVSIENIHLDALPPLTIFIVGRVN